MAVEVLAIDCASIDAEASSCAAGMHWARGIADTAIDNRLENRMVKADSTSEVIIQKEQVMSDKKLDAERRMQGTKKHESATEYEDQNLPQYA
jgi:hypothetical protein